MSAWETVIGLEIHAQLAQEIEVGMIAGEDENLCGRDFLMRHKGRGCG